MMKAFVLLAVLVPGSALLAQGGAATPPAATDIKASDIQAAVAKAKATGRDAAVRIVDASGQHLGVSMTFREKGRSAGGGTHETVSEVYHVLEGSARFVTGGTSVRRSDGGFPIQGGVSRTISKGDVVIIPAGTPHGIAEVLEDITIIVIRSDPGRVIPLQ
jgi:mannose-6-phosphate isomerase-like protein (cupin superfamily)